MKSWCIGLCRHAVLYHCLYLFERLVTSFFNSPLNLLFLRYVIFISLNDRFQFSFVNNKSRSSWKEKKPFKHSMILDDTFQKRSRSVYRSIKRRRREMERKKNSRRIRANPAAVFSRNLSYLGGEWWNVVLDRAVTQPCRPNQPWRKPFEIRSARSVARSFAFQVKTAARHRGWRRMKGEKKVRAR